MTANTGKGADGKRPTGADAKSGKARKKTSAAKQRSDEVTVRTNDSNGTAPKDDSDDTVVDVPVAGEKNDPEPASEDDDATVADAAADSSSSSSSEEDESGRTAAFRLPVDYGEVRDSSDEPGSSMSEGDGSGSEHRHTELPERDEFTKFPQESGDSMPNMGSSAAMDPPQPPSGGYGSLARGGATSENPPADGRRALGAGAPSYAPGGPGGPGGSSGAASRVAKLTGALRKPEPRSTGRKPPRKAHLQVARFEPWSVMKFSFIMSLVCFLVLFVAVAVLYVILSWLGVFDALSNTIHDLTSNDQGKSGTLNPAGWFSAARILGYTALIGTLNVLLITALATVWAVIYNMAADLVGGVEVTLKEADQ
jgi:hypothetical protein